MTKLLRLYVFFVIYRLTCLTVCLFFYCISGLINISDKYVLVVVTLFMAAYFHIFIDSLS